MKTLLTTIVLASAVSVAQTVDLTPTGGADVAVVLVKTTNMNRMFNAERPNKESIVVTKSVYFSGYIDNMQFCMWTADKLRSDRDQGGQPRYVTWSCEYMK